MLRSQTKVKTLVNSLAWDAFVKSINDNQPVPVTLEDGVAALAMAEAATQSQILGKSIQIEEVL